MTAVMRFAEARLKASSIRSSSIRLLLPGAQVDWITNTSPPRTFSLTSTLLSPSLNVSTIAWPSGMFKCRQISRASGRFELPANIFNSSWCWLMVCTVKIEQPERQSNSGTRVHLKKLAGREGFEPSIPDPKTGALPLGDRPSELPGEFAPGEFSSFAAERPLAAAFGDDLVVFGD